MFSISPKIYNTYKKQTVFLTVSDPCESLGVKIQPMESYGIEHTPSYFLDEQDRYPFLEAKRTEENIFCVEYDFAAEQKYIVRIKVDDTVIRQPQYVYAVETDLFEAQVFKCDTHIHTNYSDGEGTPIEVAIAYRKAGYDFISITDHHKMQGSIEAKAHFEALTDKFFVMRGEEIHNRGYGYFHIINLGGEVSVNKIIEAGDGSIDEAVNKYLASETYPEGTTPYICAYRKAISDYIRAGGGLAVMAHPFWECCGEYNLPAADTRYLLKSGCYDAIELLASCDSNGNGNNLQVALWQELLSEGVRIPTLGASDLHSTTEEISLFNKQFSLVFAKDKNDVLSAIKEGRCVAVNRRTDNDFFVHGSFRLVKFARFLLDEYYPRYVALAKAHAIALESADVAEITRTEADIDKYKSQFYTNK